MFEIGFPELILIAIVGLLVIGPERLPETLRTLGLWFGRMRRSFTNVKAEIEKEIGMDEVRRQLHNEAIMEEMKRIEADVKGTVDSARNTLNQGIQDAGADMDPLTGPTIDPNPQGRVSDLLRAQGGETPGADDRDHTDAGDTEVAADRDHTDAADIDRHDDRDHSDAADVGRPDDRDHTDAAGPERDPGSRKVAAGDAAKGT